MSARVLFTPREVIDTCESMGGVAAGVAELIEAITTCENLGPGKEMSKPDEITAAVADIRARFPGLAAFRFILGEAAATGLSSSAFYRITFTPTGGAPGAFKLKVQDEPLSGGVAPLTVADASAMNAQRGGKYGTIEARAAGQQAKKAMLQFTAYRARFADGEGPKAETPTSPLVHAMLWLCLAFCTEMLARYARGLRLAAWSKAHPSTSKRLPLAPADLVAAGAAAFAGEGAPGDLSPNCVILTDQAVHQDLTKYVLRFKTKIVPCVQTSIRSDKRLGERLANPIFRASVDLTSAKMQTIVLDKERPEVVVVGGKKTVRYAPAMVTRPEPGATPKVVADDTLHLLFRAGAVIEGVIDASSLCVSSQGISTPIKAALVTVQRAGAHKTIADEFYADNEVSDEEAARIMAASAAGSASAAPAESSASAASFAPAASSAADAVDDEETEEVSEDAEVVFAE